MFASPELTWEGGTAWDASAPSALLLSGARRVLAPRGGDGAGGAAPEEGEEEQEEEQGPEAEGEAEAEAEGWEVPKGLQSGAVRRAAHECEAEEQLALFAPKPLPATPSGGSVVRLACAAALL
jgi:hypothetical protein